MVRHSAAFVQELLGHFPCVALLGARQCGKTTLARQVGEGWEYFDLERTADRTQIAADPDLFLRLHPQRVVIDEAQELPALFAALRVAIDQERQVPGRFLLTGSSSPELLTAISESLAGRIGIAFLSPFSYSESCSSSGPGLVRLLANGTSPETLQQELTQQGSLQEVHDYWFRGGYPEPWVRNSPRFSKLWLDNYFDTYVARDVARHFPRLDRDRYLRLIANLAGLSGSIINYSDLARSLDTSQATVKDYLQIAHGTFLWRHLPAFAPQTTKRLVKHPKGFLRDSGLLHHLLHIPGQAQLLAHPQMGHSWEAMVIEQLLRGFEFLGERVTASYWRTSAGAGVDLVLEGRFGLLPVEIKHTQAVKPQQLLGLRRFLKEFPAPFGVVIHNDERVTRIDHNILGIPFSFL